MSKKRVSTLILVFALFFSCLNFSFANQDLSEAAIESSPSLKVFAKGEQDRQIKKFFDKKEKNSSQNSEQQINTLKDLTNVEDYKNYEEALNKKDEKKFFIKHVEFLSKSSVFTETQLQQIVVPIIDEKVSLTDIRSVVNDISKFYIINDYITSYAYLPEQNFEDGTVKIELVEGRVGDIFIEGNKYTKKKYIQDKLSAKNGEVFRLRALESDLIKFNNNNSVKLSARISHGRDPQTTDIKIKADDPFPLRLSGIFDNGGRNDVGLLRGGAVVSADSLFGLRDKMSAGTLLGKHSQSVFADYNIPINKYGTKAGFLFSYDNLDVLGAMYDKYSGNAFSYSAYVTHPFISKPDLTLDSYSSANFKYATTFFDRNEIGDSNVFSLTQGLKIRKDTKKGLWYSGHYASVGMHMLSGQNNFFKYEGNITRLHDFGHGIIGQFRVGGQFAPHNDLPWIEQYQLGGISSVRGYSESLLLGKSGYMTSAELLTPLPFLPEKAGCKKLGYVNLRKIIKGAIFVDHGAAFPSRFYDEKLNGSNFLTSVGLGIRVALKENLNARFYWGFGLSRNKYETSQPTGRFHFEITSSPDFSRLLKHKEEHL